MFVRSEPQTVQYILQATATAAMNRPLKNNTEHKNNTSTGAKLHFPQFFLQWRIKVGRNAV